MLRKLALHLSEKKNAYDLFHFTAGVAVTALLLVAWTSQYILDSNILPAIPGLILTILVVAILNQTILKNSQLGTKYLVKGILILFLTVVIELTLLFYFSPILYQICYRTMF